MGLATPILTSIMRIVKISLYVFNLPWPVPIQKNRESSHPRPHQCCQGDDIHTHFTPVIKSTRDHEKLLTLLCITYYLIILNPNTESSFPPGEATRDERGRPIFKESIHFLDPVFWDYILHLSLKYLQFHHTEINYIFSGISAQGSSENRKSRTVYNIVF